MSFKVIDDKPRRVYNEGRSQGMGMAFARREGDVLICQDAPSTCKDYLSDRVYCEATGKPYSRYGWVGKKEGTFDNGVYLIAKILGAGASTNAPYPSMPKDIKDMNDGHKMVELLMRVLEAQIPAIAFTTTVDQAGDNCLVIQIDKWWVEAGYRISLYSLIFRNGVLWDGKGSPIDFLAKTEGLDALHMRQALPKLKRLLAGELPPWNYDLISDPHNYGICGLNWPVAQT